MTTAMAPAPASRAAAGRLAVSGLQELVLAAARSQAGRAALLGPLGEVLLLDAVAASAQGPLAGLARTAGLRRALERAFHAAAGADLKPASLAALTRRLHRGSPESARRPARLDEVARLYRSYREHMGPRRLDAAQLWHKGALALAESPLLADVAVIELTGLHRVPGWDAVPTPHALLAALDGLCHGGRRVRVLLPEVEERPQLVQALAPLYDALFRKHDLDIDTVPVPLGPEAVGESPWARLLRGLFRKTGAPPLVAAAELTDDELSFSPLPSPRAEARHVARRVRDLLDAGTPPAEIAVVAASRERRQLLLEALLRYEVPVYAPPPTDLFGETRSAGLPPPLQALLGLLDTLAAGLPREGLIQAMTSRYLRFPGPLHKRPWHVARALRAAGVRELGPLTETAPAAPPAEATLWSQATPAPATAGRGADYRQRLEQWLRQQASQMRPLAGPSEAAADPAPPTSPPLPESLAAVARQVDAVVRELLTLPETATLGEHCAALRRLAERLQLSERALAPGAAEDDEADPAAGSADAPPDDDAAALAALECLAQARDLAAVATLTQVLDELPRQARRLGLGTQPLSRSHFTGLLKAALLRTLPPAGPLGTAGAGVFVGELGQLGEQRWAQLFITGLLDGELPQRTPEDAVLDDDDRRRLNQLCDAPVWPLAQHEGERTPLLFAEAMAHSRAVHLSWPTGDAEGRPLLRSALVDVVLRASGRGEPQRPRVPLLPWPDQARHPSELWARAALPPPSPTAERAGSEPLAGRHGDKGPGVRACGPALLSALAACDRERAARLRARVAIEQLRGRWFATLSAEPSAATLDQLAGPFVGRLGEPAGIARLQPRLPGSPEHPLSASALEDYAKCPFRFFVRRVLKATPLTEGGEDLDPLASGRLHHAVLERFFLERRRSGRLPLRGDAEDRAAMEQAIDDELQRFHLREQTGHPELLKVRVRRLRADLQRLLQREAQTPIDSDCVPARFEHHFGPLALQSAQGEGEGEGGMALHIEGIIDRVDLGRGRAVVLDYKAGRLLRYEELLRSQLLLTSFQLPLYAAALTVDDSLREDGPPLTQVSARYYSLRQGRTSRPLDDAEMISLDPQVRLRVPEHNVAEVAYRLWRRLRAGDFRVAPRTCEGCGLEATCRIAAAPPVPAEPADEALDSATSPSSAHTPAPSTLSPTRDWPVAEPRAPRVGNSVSQRP
jgi:RecB family exonuclease